MRKYLLVLFLVFLFTGIKLPAQNPYIQHYTTNDGLPSNVVYYVFQDRNKFIWFATNAGVARFDGTRFAYFRKQDGLSCNDVVRIKEDTQGRIWFFNLNASLNYFFENKIYNEINAPFLDSLKTGEFFRDFFEDDDGTLYFYYNHQRDIYTLDSQNIVRKYKMPEVPVTNPISHETFDGMVIRYLTKGTDKSFYLYTIAGVFQLPALTEKPVRISDEYHFKAIYAAKGRQNYVCVTKKEFNHWVIKKCSEDLHIDEESMPINLESDYISSAMVDGNGYLWVSVFDKGLICYRDRTMIDHFDIKEAQAVTEDDEGNIWVGSLKDGAYRINPFAIQHEHFANSHFQNKPVLALAPHISKGIWCTNGQSIYLLKNNYLYSSDFKKDGSSFNHIWQFSDNSLIIGESNTRHYALTGINDDDKAKKVRFDHESLSEMSIKNLTINHAGNLISAFDAFILLFIDPKGLFNNIRGLGFEKRIYNTYFNLNDDLVVNSKTNYIYKNDSLLVYNDLSRFDNKIITDHLIFSDSVELFNIEGDSLYILKDGKLFNISSAFELNIDEQIRHLLQVKEDLIIATTKNFFICQNPLNIIDNRPIHLTPVDLSFRNIHDILFNEDRLYVANDDGLTVIPYADIYKILKHRPIPYFRSININDTMEVSDPKMITLTGRNRIHIGFGSINYSASPVIFSYKLEGLDNDWITGAGTNVVYQNLPKGHYLFKLRVRKPESDWGEPVTMGINIRATIWQHPVFFILAGFLVIGFIVVMILRRKNAEMRKTEMEHQLVVLEQKALQSMMNPHFIFNSLGSIQNYLLQSKAAEAGLYLSQFARLIRQNLNAIDSVMINLEEETDRLKNYLDLERKRMENKFDYHLEIDKSVESDDIQIPSMIVQPFVENSIWHGIAHLDGNGIIYLLFRINDDKSMEITVEDNGIGIMNAEKFNVKGEKHLKLGMQMTRKRLELLGKKYHVETKIEISEVSPGSPNPGTKAVLIVPFI